MKIDHPWLATFILNSTAALQMANGAAPRTFRMALDIATFCVMFSVALMLLVFGNNTEEAIDLE